MKPILKYRGGKSQEIKHFEHLIPDFDRYIEPFFGGGALFFHLEPENSLINDINTPLINFYQEVQQNFPTIRRELDDLDQIYKNNRTIYLDRKREALNERVHDPNEDLYYQIRNMFNQLVEPQYSPGTIYYFINKTAYSGMIRYNQKGEYNVPYGRYANFNTKLLTPEHNQLLQNTEIFNNSYSDILHMSEANDFIFLDPPYDTTFSSYGNEVLTGDFDEENHRELAQDFINLNSRAMMVIGDTPLIRELYQNYIYDNYEKRYSVNIRNRFQSSSNHLIITNYL